MEVRLNRKRAASTVRRKQRLMIGTLSVVTGLFAQMVPLILPQTPQKRCDLWKRVVLRCPLNMLRKAHHLEHRRRLVPCGSN